MFFIVAHAMRATTSISLSLYTKTGFSVLVCMGKTVFNGKMACSLFVCYYYPIQILLPLLPFLIQHVKGGGFAVVVSAAWLRSSLHTADLLISTQNIFVYSEAHISLKTCVLGWQWIWRGYWGGALIFYLREWDEDRYDSSAVGTAQ